MLTSVEPERKESGGRCRVSEEPAALDDLGDVALAVVRVELEELAEGHRAPLGVPAFADPVGRARGAKDRRRGLAEIPECVESRAPETRVALPISETGGPHALVVPGQSGGALGEDLSDPYRTDGLGVGDVDHDLLDGPLARNRLAAQLLLRESVQGPNEPVRSGGIRLEKG